MNSLLAKSHAFNPDAPPRRKRQIRAPEPAFHEFSAGDGVGLRLVRYRAGSRGPVVLAHGMASSSWMWALDTIDTNLVEYLTARDFDIWLLDWRASIVLPASASAYTADDIATYDWPAAVKEVQKETGAPSVQVVAHCIGALTLHMAMLSGLQGVSSAVSLQVGAHIVAPRMAEMKAHLYLPTFIKVLGTRSMTAYTDTHENWLNRIYDEALKLYPVQAEEVCDSPVCRRICFEYGMLYKHNQLNQATHDNLHELFGVTGMRIFEHLALIERRGHVVDAAGKESYLPHLDRMAIPVRYISGAENSCILPESTGITHDLLAEKNGRDLYSRYVIPDYGHVDSSFGKNAARDVYPLILDHLESTRP
jgi:cholesterol oxidase